jgi:transcription elongation factor SPT5
VLTLMRRFLNLENTSKPLNIHSVFCRDGIPGYVYVEADRVEAVQEAIVGLQFIYARSIKIVPVNEMTQCLTIKSKEKELLINSWVRIKRGKYAGDLGQVIITIIYVTILLLILKPTDCESGLC